MTRLTRIVIATLLGVVVIAGLWFAFGRRQIPSPSNAALTPQVSLAGVREGVVEETISLTGRVGAAAGTQAKLAFAVSGAVESVDVSLGEHVDAGAPLARLDPTSYSLAAQQAQSEAQAAAQGAALAAIDRSSMKVRRDEVELERQQRLYRAGIVALRDVEAAQTTLWADRGEARSQRIALSQAQAQSAAAGVHAAGSRYDVERTTLRAPAAGTVVGIFVAPGEMVDSTTAAVALSANAQTSATLDIPGSQLSRVTPGDLVHVRSGNARWESRIAGIAPAVDPATGLALLTISGVPAGTAAGTPIDATVVARTIRGLVVPRDAIVEDPQTGAELVFVRTVDAGGVAHFTARKVTIDARDARWAHVVSGLRNGERIAAQGAIDLLAQPG
jgi:RND family efflux transporter MFP subunit